MGRRKAAEDVQQRTLFSCKNFSGSQHAAAAAPLQQTSSCRAGSKAVDASADNQQENIPCVNSRGPQPAARASPQKKQHGKYNTPARQEAHPWDAQLAHAVAAITQQVEGADVAPSAVPPARSDMMATAAAKVSELRTKLNAEQISVATAPPSPPVFILAGAGTGKTTTLTARVWHMLQCGIFPRVFSAAANFFVYFPLLYAVRACSFLLKKTTDSTMSVCQGKSSALAACAGFTLCMSTCSGRALTKQQPWQSQNIQHICAGCRQDSFNHIHPKSM